MAGPIDKMHLALSPVFLGSGESLFAGPDGGQIDLPTLGFTSVQTSHSERAPRVVSTKSELI